MCSPGLRAAMLTGIFGAFCAPPVAQAEPVVLLADDFTGYPVADVLDAERYGERIGPWQLTTQHYSWHGERYDRKRMVLPFRIVQRDGRRFLDEPESLFNVVVKAGRPQWRDYTLELELAVSDGPAGPIVRYQTSRRNYWVCFESGQPVKLYRRDQEEHVLLGVALGFRAEKDRLYHCRVTCDGPRLTVAVDGRPLIEAEDDAYGHGQIALRTEGPSRFTAVKVLAEPAESERLAAERKRVEERTVRDAEALPPAKLVHTAALPGKPDRVIGVHDVNDDGALEIAAYYSEATGSAKSAPRLCLFDWEGKPLWAMEPSAPDESWPARVKWLNVADVDGDGCTEVVCVRGSEILIVEGASGAIKRRAPHPDTYAGRSALAHGLGGLPYILGAYVCNLRGLPSARDLVFKDEYMNLWAYTDELRLLWHRHLNAGHCIAARDVNGDGKDEVMGGYSMLRPDGTTMWTVPGGDPDHNRYPGAEHADGVLIERFGPGPEAPLRVAIAGSDLGFVLLDVEGHVLVHHRVGHAQWVHAARFRSDLPGRQIAVGTFWGNSAIFNLFDCDGNVLLIREPTPGKLMPAYWLGGDNPLVVMGGGNAGLWNRHFDRILELPGGLQVPPYVLDVNDDGLDELLVLDGDKIQVYAPEGVKATVPAPPTSLTNWWFSSCFYR